MLRGIDQVSMPSRWRIQFDSTFFTHHYRLRAWNPDALIVINSGREVLLPLLDYFRSKLVVSIEEDLSDMGIPSILINDDALGAFAAQHLIERGLERFVAYRLDEYGFARRREAGFERALQAAGKPCVRLNSADVPTEELGGKGAFWGWMVQCLAKMSKPVGVFAPADDWAIDLMNLCRSSEVLVPDELVIVGACDDSCCRRCIPEMSSVPVPFYELGLKAARTLASMVAGGTPPPRQVVEPLPAVQRGSSAISFQMPEDVRQALRYIVQHALDPISVEDVARAAVTRRRTLETAFRRHCGRSILQEIQRVRVERAKRLLETTDAVMDHIASGSGFGSVDRFYDVFKAVEGVTPQVYRTRIRPTRA
ncbi:MAG TPA: substrate-binding domain-containing protein [Tepidisphaeraceae bacterium]|nr:substrate-binding domain-containing protein [Tepidisphaeraceae bacterium]